MKKRSGNRNEKKRKYICACYNFSPHEVCNISVKYLKCLEFYNILFKTYVHVIYTLLIMHDGKRLSIFQLHTQAYISPVKMKDLQKIAFLKHFMLRTHISKSLFKFHLNFILILKVCAFPHNINVPLYDIIL